MLGLAGNAPGSASFGVSHPLSACPPDRRKARQRPISQWPAPGSPFLCGMPRSDPGRARGASRGHSRPSYGCGRGRPGHSLETPEPRQSAFPQKLPPVVPASLHYPTVADPSLHWAFRERHNSSSDGVVTGRRGRSTGESGRSPRCGTAGRRCGTLRAARAWVRGPCRAYSRSPMECEFASFPSPGPS